MQLTITNVLHTLFADIADAQSIAATGNSSEHDEIRRNEAYKRTYDLARRSGFGEYAAVRFAKAARMAWFRGETPEGCALRCVPDPSESATDAGARA